MSQVDYQKLRNKKVLITGGLGFIGSNIAHRCVAFGAEVTLLDACTGPYGWNHENILEIKDQVTFVKGNILDRPLLNSLVENKDIIFHMAAQVGREISMEDPQLDANVNCTGTLNVLEACRTQAHMPKIVFAGSRGQVGEPVYLPVDEKHPDNPTDIYGINKLAAEKYCMLYHHVYDLPVVSLRLNNVYGPRCQMHANFYGILNWFMSNAMQNQLITVYGKGSQTRDYVYIDDVVDAFIRAAIVVETSGEVYYIGSGVETIFIDMVQAVVQAVGKGEIVHIPFPESREKIDITKFVVSTEKFHQATGWTSAVDLKTGVEQTFAFYKNRFDKYLNR